jgi:thiamine pyrophosphokinase
VQVGVQVFLIDPRNRIRMIDRPIYLSKKEQFGAYVSLIPWAGPVTGLTLEGMKYPLENATLTGDTTRGISNEIAADMAHISLANGRLLVFETRD